MVDVLVIFGKELIKKELKMTKRFDNAIKTGVRAFFDGTLKKGLCSACMVGNICGGNPAWSYVFATATNGVQLTNAVNYFGAVKEVIDNTGYAWQDLARIEKAFEQNTKIQSGLYSIHTQSEIMQDQFNGLMAVVDVLMELDGMDKSDNTYRKMFEYTEEFKPKYAGVL
jgi:hypothetical protein